MFLLTSWFVRVSIDTKLDLLSQRSVTHKCDHTAMRGTNHVYTVNIVNLVSSLKVTVQVGRSPPDDRTYCHLIMTKTIPFTTKMLQFTDEQTNREKVPNTFSKLLFLFITCVPSSWPPMIRKPNPISPLWRCTVKLNESGLSGGGSVSGAVKFSIDLKISWDEIKGTSWFKTLHDWISLFRVYLLAALATAFLSDGYELNRASERLSKDGCPSILFSYPVSWFLVLSPAVARFPVLPCSTRDWPTWFEPITGVDFGRATLGAITSCSLKRKRVIPQIRAAKARSVETPQIPFHS